MAVTTDWVLTYGRGPRPATATPREWQTMSIAEKHDLLMELQRIEREQPKAMDRVREQIAHLLPPSRPDYAAILLAARKRREATIQGSPRSFKIPMSEASRRRMQALRRGEITLAGMCLDRAIVDHPISFTSRMGSRV